MSKTSKPGNAGHTSANDWASKNPANNITWAEAKAFREKVFPFFELENFTVKTESLGSVSQDISESELAHNQYQRENAVNLFARPVAGGDGEQFYNVARMQADVRACADADDPQTAFATLIQRLYPLRTNVPTMVSNGLRLVKVQFEDWLATV